MLSLDPFIHRRITVLNLDTPAHVAAIAMRENKIGCVLITDGAGHLAGIVTDRDFACRWATEHLAPDIPVSRIMTPEIVKADERMGLSHIIALMENQGVRRIPIIAARTKGPDRILGIVTLDDLIASGSIAPSHLAQIVRRQLGRRLGLPSRFQKTARSAQRSSAHFHQTLDRFYSFLSMATGLGPDLIPQIAQFILSAIVMRITATAATHFVAQLPNLIQGPLLKLPSGPDRNINSQYIIGELVSHYRFTEKFARTILTHFLSGLGNLIDAGQISHLKCQLPRDLQAFFPGEPSPVIQAAAPGIGRSIGTMALTSSGFEEGGQIPQRFTGEGVDRSPPLQWSNVPATTKEFALICEDLDPAYETSWVHWLVYGISNTITYLPEGLPATPELDFPVRICQGKNSWGNIGYQGPMPPVSHPAHRYLFRLYALDREIPLRGGATRTQLALELREHILAEAVLAASYRSSVTRQTA